MTKIASRGSCLKEKFQEITLFFKRHFDLEIFREPEEGQSFQVKIPFNKTICWRTNSQLMTVLFPTICPLNITWAFSIPNKQHIWRGKNLLQNIQTKTGKESYPLKGFIILRFQVKCGWWSPWEGETFLYHSFPVFVWIFWNNTYEWKEKGWPGYNSSTCTWEGFSRQKPRSTPWRKPWKSPGSNLSTALLPWRFIDLA